MPKVIFLFHCKIYVVCRVILSCLAVEFLIDEDRSYRLLAIGSYIWVTDDSFL